MNPLALAIELFWARRGFGLLHHALERRCASSRRDERFELRFGRRISVRRVPSSARVVEALLGHDEHLARIGVGSRCATSRSRST